MHTEEGAQYYVDRNIYLFGEIDSETALEVITAIKAINKYDEMMEESRLNNLNELVSEGIISPSSIEGLSAREPIMLEINSGGGHTSAGFSIISAIENSETPIIGYVTGDCMSMATGVLASCHYRLSSEYARFMIHDVYSITEGKYNDLMTSLSYIQDIRGNYKDVLMKYTEIEDEELEVIVNANADHHFAPKRAKEIGLIDAIDTDQVNEELLMRKLYGVGVEEVTEDESLVKEETKEDIRIEDANEIDSEWKDFLEPESDKPENIKSGGILKKFKNFFN